MKFPWILSRRRLLFIILLDVVAFCSSYFLLASYFDSSVNYIFPCSILCLIWIFWSYIIGRYYYNEPLRTKFPVPLEVSFHLVITSIIVIVLSLVLFSTIFSLLGFDLIQSFKSNNLYIVYLVCSAVFSGIYQLPLLSWSRSEYGLPKDWLFIGSENSYTNLQLNLKWSRQKINLIRINNPQNLLYSDKPVVFDSLNDQTNEFLPLLLQHQRKGFSVLSIQTWSEKILHRIPSDYLNDLYLLSGHFAPSQSDIQARLKRFGDFTFSFIFLILISPLIIISSLFIYLEDGMPILYSQTRTGKDGKTFKIWKLRSMTNCAEDDGPQWSQRRDPRITKVGSLIRKLRIDELPQLFCVLRGDMSLIGPRPERPEFDEKLEDLIPYYRLRQLMRPGLSGWAQVNYPYGASVKDSSNKLSYDLFYINNFSVLLDFLIFIKTVRLVFNAKGSIPED